MHLGVFEFVIALVLIGTVSGIITGGMKLERQRMRLRAGESEANELKALLGEMHQEVTTLKDRVRVLERLATDGDRNLANEIERLRSRETRSGV